MGRIQEAREGEAMNAFWDKVDNCDHKNLSPNYLRFVECSTPYCSGDEVHCLDCGVYISKCDCGANNGMSGWSDTRWEKHNARKKGIKP